jgi:hypothetical protein
LRGADSPDHKYYEHSDGCKQKQRSAPYAFYKKTATSSNDNVDELKNSVDKELGGGICDAYLVQNSVDVIA